MQDNSKIIMLEYNEIKGVKQGKNHKWLKYEDNNENYLDMCINNQIANPISSNYMIAIVNKETKQIQWKNATLMKVSSTGISKRNNEQGKETTVEKWSMEHKKQIISQFGTNKSKRKINQRLNNIIN